MFKIHDLGFVALSGLLHSAIQKDAHDDEYPSLDDIIEIHKIIISVSNDYWTAGIFVAKQDSKDVMQHCQVGLTKIEAVSRCLVSKFYGEKIAASLIIGANVDPNQVELPI